MRLLLNLIIFIIICALGVYLYNSIQEPIAFKTQLDKRENAVVDKLIKVRDAQQWYYNVTGEYTDNWEELKDTLELGKIKVEKIIGDPDDPNFTGEIIREVSYIPVVDTIMSLGLRLDSLKYVPYGNGAVFAAKADTLTYKQTFVNVVEVSTQYKDFMGKFADPVFSKYDNMYDPNKKLKFGDLSAPSLSGSWDRQ